MDDVVEVVFLCEEVFQTGVARQSCLVKVTDITPRAKCTKGPFLVAAAYHHSQHISIAFIAA